MRARAARPPRSRRYGCARALRFRRHPQKIRLRPALLRAHVSRVPGNLSTLGVQYNGAIVGGRRVRRGQRGDGQVAAGARRARGAVARAAPRASGAPGPAARRRGRRRGPLGARCRRGARPAPRPPQALPFRLPARRATLSLLPAGGSRARVPHAIRRRANVPMSRPAYPGDGCAGEQVQLRAGRVLLLVLRGEAVLPVRAAAERVAAAGGRALPGRGGARGGLLGAVPGGGGGQRAAPAPAPSARAAAARAGRARTDPLDRGHAFSESARFEVIVLR